MQSVILKNGLVIVNFSSPHEFVFDDGSILNAVDNETSRKLSLDMVKKVTKFRKYDNVKMQFHLTDNILNELDKLNKNDFVDIILVSFPLLKILSEENMIVKERTILMVDRINKIVNSKQFSIL